MILRRRRPAPVTLFSLVSTVVFVGTVVGSVSAVEPRAAAPNPPAPPVPPASPAAPTAPAIATPGALGTVPSVARLPALTGLGTVVHGFSGTIVDSDGDQRYRAGYEDGDLVFDRRDRDFHLSLRIEQPDQVEISPDLRSIVSMGRGSYAVLRTSDGTSRQRLEIAPGPNGEPRYDWRVDGEDRAFDERGRQWMGLALETALRFHEASSLRGRESSLRGRISSIRGRRSSLEGRISSIRGRRSSLEGRISSIRGHVSSLRGRISSTRGHVSSLRGRISSLNGRISALRAQRHEVPTGSSEHTAEMRRLAEEMNALVDDEIAAIRARIVEVEAEIEAYDAEARVAEIEREIEQYDAESRIREVRRQIDELDVEGQVGEIERQIDELDVEGQVRELEREIEQLDAQNRASALEASAGSAYDELQRLVRRID